MRRSEAATALLLAGRPVAFVVLRPGHPEPADELRAWANARLGKVQRLSQLVLVDELPRSSIGKVLKRELRERLEANPTAGQ